MTLAAIRPSTHHGTTALKIALSIKPHPRISRFENKTTISRNSWYSLGAHLDLTWTTQFKSEPPQLHTSIDSSILSFAPNERWCICLTLDTWILRYESPGIGPRG